MQLQGSTTFKYQITVGGSNVTVTSPAVTLGQPQLLEGVNLTTGKGVVNTTSGTSTTQPGPQTLLRSSNFIGKSSGGSNFLSGQILEILLYSLTGAPGLSFDQDYRSFVEAYLIQKYQLLTAAPAVPVFAIPTSTTFLQPTQVAIVSDIGANTFITTDGSTPTVSSPVYCAPLMVNYTQTIKALSVKNGVSSSVASATYTLDSTQFPAPSPSDFTAPTINLQLPAPSL